MHNKKIIAILGLVAVTGMHCGAPKKQEKNLLEQAGEHMQNAINAITGQNQGKKR